MEFRDLAYWLQGFFELTDADVVLEKQLTIINAHVQMAIQHGKDNKNASQCRDFAMWLNGLITNKVSLDNAETNSVKVNLNSVFEHEIDKTMPDLKGVLQKIHDTAKAVVKNDPLKAVLRC